jgi:putative flippase GtrA
MTVPGKPRRLQPLVEARGGALLQLGRFSLVGVSNTAISFVVFAALRWADIPAPAAAALGFIAGALNGYWWNGRWTFAGGGRRRSLVRYGVVQGAGAALSAAIVAAGTSAGLAPTVAFVASMVVVTSSTFVANRSWAFATVAGEDSQETPSDAE